MKCESCGAPVENGVCTYCGKRYELPKGEAQAEQSSMRAQPFNNIAQNQINGADAEKQKRKSGKLTTCKTCGAEIAKGVKVCPSCGAKQKKPIWKRWWFWLIVISLIFGGTGASDKGNTSSSDTPVVAEQSAPAKTNTPAAKSPQVKAPEPVEAPQTEAPAAAEVPQAEAPAAAEAPQTESPAAAEAPQEEVPAAVEVPVETSSVTVGEKNALTSAKNYLAFTAFSYDGLIDQLEFEGYSNEEATYAVDNCGADWDAQAAKKAKSYLSFSAFSHKGLIEQLEFEGFTSEQAAYGAEKCGADWKEQAAKKAASYISLMSFSKQGLIDQLKFEGFTQEEAEYGASQVGY